MKKTVFSRNRILTILTVAAFATVLSGCSLNKPRSFVPAADGSNYISYSERAVPENQMSSTAAATERRFNFWQSLSVPTQFNRIRDTWFIVDCYHNQILFNDAPDAQYIALTDWQVVNSDITQGHTIAGDGEIFLADDTENNRVLVFERIVDKFITTQTYWNTGIRPHCTVYDEDTATWYVWSSMTGELFLFRRAAGTTDVYLTEQHTIEKLKGIYIRSFTIDRGRIYFVSGMPSSDNPDYKPAILCCDLKTLEIVKEYPVPDEIAGMAQIVHSGKNDWFITVSTDAAGDQGAAALLRTDDPSHLADGGYTDVFAEYFGGNGTPYNLSQVDQYWYLTVHVSEGPCIWRFELDDAGGITNVVSLF